MSSGIPYTWDTDCIRASATCRAEGRLGKGTKHHPLEIQSTTTKKVVYLSDSGSSSLHTVGERMDWKRLTLVFCWLECASAAGISCRNEQGQAVDWYILYKQPSINDENGLVYLYMDESTGGWVPAHNPIDDQKSALAQTLLPLFQHFTNETINFGYILYNDQPPEPFKTASSSFGHSKGLVMMDQETGIWLSHSTPHFPGFDITGFWPNSGYANGQTFICGTYKYSAFRNIAVQLQYIHVYSFDAYIPEYFYPELQCVVDKGCYPKKTPWDRQLNMTSLGGHSFISYAKYSRYHDDLYSGLLDKHLESAFYAKSWGRLLDPLPSNCSVDFSVYNVETVQLPTTEPYSITKDHSKWCVTMDSKLHRWTCIADMNREVSQEHRGGGAICTDNAAVWSAFLDIVNTYQPCQS
ncbi:deoxyribonuclease-2-alpha-like [Denticeps clupeoides]|uniref:deoxyribonuclease-2-alpha-like n=1 Tax=Denticeps clupeoides TaxID=299321 RepID=UPI0010A47210|nr:deoxyribonuclease-2-alpha-like [Denticeps clupeoides]